MAALIAALLAGALLRSWFILHLPYISDDSLMYGGLARNLLEHGVYGFSAAGAGAIRPSLIRLPGYPLFLALCFRVFGMERYSVVLTLQAICDLASCVLIAAVAGRLFSRRAGCAALWLAVLCPFTANYTAAVLSETLTLFMLSLTLFALERWETRGGSGFNRWLFVLSFALAYGILLRPEQGLVEAAVLPCMLWMRLRLASGASAQGSSSPSPTKRILAPVVAVALLTLLPLLPWTVRNWRTFGVFEPLAPRFATDPGEVNPSGFQRWFRTWAIDYASTEQVYWNYDGAPISISDLPDRAFDSNLQYRATEDLLNDYDQTNAASAEFDARFDSLARQRISEDPLRYYVALPLARVANMTFRPRDYMLPWPLEWWKFRLHRRQTIAASLYALLSLAYFLLAALTLWHRRAWVPRHPLLCAMLSIIVLRTLLLLTVDNSEMRYTLEFFPILIVLAAASLVPTSHSSPKALSPGRDGIQHLPSEP